MPESPYNQSPDQPASLHEAAVAYRAAEDESAYPLQTREDQGWAEFREQCRRQMQRPIEYRLKYGFLRKLKRNPGEDSCRVFDTMEDYRAWCVAHLPDYLGYKRPSP